MPLGTQLLLLFILSIPIACIAWTVTHEEVFREPREYCLKRSEEGKTLLERKFFYLFTCEYCFSHYVTIAILLITGFRMVFDDWRGYLISGFSLVWIATVYMSLYVMIRTDDKKDKMIIKEKEQELNGD